jgi:hypothetical protein
VGGWYLDLQMYFLCVFLKKGKHTVEENLTKDMQMFGD